MKLTLINKFTCLVMLVIMIVAVFIRENVFLEINAILNGHTYNKAYFYFFDETLSQLSVKELLILKWVLSVAFISLVATFTYLIIKIWFKNATYTKIVVYAYAAITSIALSCYGVLSIFSLYNDYYFILRKILGLAHSPIPFFVLFALFYFLDKKELSH